MNNPDRRLYLISLLTDIAFMMFPFVVTREFAEHDVSMSTAGALGAVSMVSYGIMTSFSGRLADRFGYRITISSGGLVACLAMTGAVFARNPIVYFVAIAFLGGGIGLIYPSVIGALSAGRSEQQMSGVLLRFCIAWNIGLMLGQGGGGLILAHLGGAAQTCAFVICAAAMFLVALTGLTLRRVRLPANTADAPHVPPPATRKQAMDFAWMSWTGLITGTFSVGVLIFVLPHLMVELDIPADRHGLILSCNRLANLGIYVLLHGTVFWRYRTTTTVAAHITNLVAMLLLVRAADTTAVFVAVVVSAVMIGTVYYVSIFYATVAYSDAEKGKAGGIHETIIAIGISSGAIGGGLLGDRFGVRAPFIAAAALTVATGLLQLAFHRRRRRRVS